MTAGGSGLDYGGGGGTRRGGCGRGSEVVVATRRRHIPIVVCHCNIPIQFYVMFKVVLLLNLRDFNLPVVLTISLLAL